MMTPLLKRIAICFVGFLSIGFLAFGYFWIHHRRVQVEANRKFKTFFEEEKAQANALEKLGDVSLSPANLTLQELEEKLHQPSLKRTGAKNTTRLGWVCGGEQCAIWASFLVPYGKEVLPSTQAAAIVMFGPRLETSRRWGIGELYLGEAVAQAEDLCQKRNCQPTAQKRWKSWDQDWNFTWGDMNGKISLLLFRNEKLMANVLVPEQVNRRESSGKKAAK